MIIDNNEAHNEIEKGDFVLFSLRDHKIVYRRSNIIFKGDVLNAIFDLENDFVYFITSNGINRTKALWQNQEQIVSLENYMKFNNFDDES